MTKQAQPVRFHEGDAVVLASPLIDVHGTRSFLNRLHPDVRGEIVKVLGATRNLSEEYVVKFNGIRKPEWCEAQELRFAR